MEKNKRSQSLYLEDMIDSINKILEYTKGMDFVQFESNALVKDAVLLNMQRIREGANRISVYNTEKYPQISWRQMANFRIIVSHIYFKLEWCSLGYDSIKP